MTKSLPPWPWAASPRGAPTGLSGDLPSIIAFELVPTEEELRKLTAMICSGMPDASEITACWSREGTNTLCVSVETPSGKLLQRFVRTSDGVAALHDLFMLTSNHHGRGHARKLMRNLVHAYDELGIRHMSTYANYGNGGYTWAALGARALEPQLQRDLLPELIDVQIRAGRIHADDREGILDLVDEAEDEELMQVIAALVSEDGEQIGRHILVPHGWEAYWDLADPAVRQYLTDALNDD
jgi:hypothetical protein